MIHFKQNHIVASDYFAPVKVYQLSKGVNFFSNPAASVVSDTAYCAY